MQKQVVLGAAINAEMNCTNAGLVLCHRRKQFLKLEHHQYVMSTIFLRSGTTTKHIQVMSSGIVRYAIEKDVMNGSKRIQYEREKLITNGK